MSAEMTLMDLPSACSMMRGFLRSFLMSSHSKYPFRLSSSAGRLPSVMGSMPAAVSICIMSEVPERGRPETMRYSPGLLEPSSVAFLAASSAAF